MGRFASVHTPRWKLYYRFRVDTNVDDRREDKPAEFIVYRQKMESIKTLSKR